MVLDDDVLDSNGKVLFAAGIRLTSDYVRRLAKLNIPFISVREPIKENREYAVVRGIAGAAVRRRLIKGVEEAFSGKGRLLKQLPYLRQYIKQVIRELSGTEQVLLYLEELQTSSDYLFIHSVNVCLFAIALGKAMALNEEEISVLGLGALLHDLGKTQIPRNILDKKGPLTPEEFALVRGHVIIGGEILSRDCQLDERVLFIALQHHERYDGAGYPHSLKFEQIHPLARIVSVADVYDALTTDRVYRPQIESSTAIQLILGGSRTYFDPGVLKTFKRIAVPYGIGCSVKLNNGLSGAVLRLNSGDLGRPVIWTLKGAVNLLHEPELQIIKAM
ncbi:Hypothetical protein LUCI_2099 [Lucifera butyrica]|uniref:Uncharacterized protein n=2 Tax=Lucifera butyrica TaxID=1351585 RepID=A0A498R9B8_9FIRM|nr:Hypothetical protein LUCI_2099 [Lucifera butyrica]